MERHLLITISEKHDNLFGVRFVGNFFAHKEKMKITLLYLTPKPPGRFEADMETELRNKKSEAIGRKALNEAKQDLLKLGFMEDQVFTKLRPRMSSKVNEIIQEGSEGRYDAVVLGRRGLTRLEQTFDESVTSDLFEKDWGFPLWICRKPDSERKHVLACVDGSDASHRMLDHVGFILGQAQNQNVTLLAVSRKGNVGDKAVDGHPCRLQSDAGGRWYCSGTDLLQGDSRGQRGQGDHQRGRFGTLCRRGGRSDRQGDGLFEEGVRGFRQSNPVSGAGRSVPLAGLRLGAAIIMCRLGLHDAFTIIIR